MSELSLLIHSEKRFHQFDSLSSPLTLLFNPWPSARFGTLGWNFAVTLLNRVEEALHQNKCKIITITHTEASIDCVCSVGHEVNQFDKWGLHTVLTTSQKLHQVYASFANRLPDLHKAVFREVKAARGLELRQLANKPDDAVYLPKSIVIPDMLPRLLAKGVVMAGDFHQEFAMKYLDLGSWDQLVWSVDILGYPDM
ncbi:hypothetical protein BDZ91DRAFT_781781 [Kalaharituber pfeilii]|nr:hypothetical protein BDZ91DRAFT_781781 [Kalaharituber pfeilii]